MEEPECGAHDAAPVAIAVGPAHGAFHLSAAT
jgi:hypothetical protein